MAKIDKRENLNQGIPDETGLDPVARAALQRQLSGGDGGIKVGSFRDLQVGLTATPVEDRPTAEGQDDDNLVTVAEQDAATGNETLATQIEGLDTTATATTDDDVDWSEYTVEELKDELRAQNLSTTGTKDELIARLEEG